ncbi:MAG TPA: aspartate aminotransferase family protein [Bryobacteraceae bacterium]|nr:aspartate aminotransferase family protein [Bryobacteraceae bacterium]
MPVPALARYSPKKGSILKQQYPKSAEILERNRRFIPGGVVSVNRATQPEIVFVKGRGAYLWDAEGNQYIDYHAGFAPHFLGHNDPYVTEAVIQGLREDASLYGSGTTVPEGRLAELICEHVPAAESVQFLNTGSEATYQAIRLARGVTGKDHVINMQGGYNGWHNDVSNNLMTPLATLGPRRVGGEYPYLPISAGVPLAHQALVHAVNFNDLAAVEFVCQTYPVAALITEPILQNIGIVHPEPGYLQGLRALADKYNFLLIFDEVKTGFRHGIGGCSAMYGVRPDLLVFGKAIANGYPLAALAGKREYMDRFVDPSPARRVLLAGTYNSHPVPTLAAIATIERLLENDGEVYRTTEALGARMQAGLEAIAEELEIEATVARQGSAFCLYFMDHQPKDWHDLAENHAFAADDAMRLALVGRGIYPFPLATKQWSISAAHSAADIDRTLEEVRAVLRTVEGLPARRTAAVRAK